MTNMRDGLGSNISQLVEGRDSAYASAWLMTGEILAFIQERRPGELLVLMTKDAPFFLNWVTILCKLMRMLGTPANVDHWEDVAGYATLVADYLRGRDKHRKDAAAAGVFPGDVSPTGAVSGVGYSTTMGGRAKNG